MKARLRNLEAQLGAIEDAADSDVRMAAVLRLTWVNEYNAQLSEEEVEARLRLAREIHAGSIEGLAEVEGLIAAESEYVDDRAREHVAGMPSGECRRWKALLGVSEAR